MTKPTWMDLFVILMAAPIILGPIFAFHTGHIGWLAGLFFLCFFL